MLTIRMAMPVRMPWATPTVTMPYTLATMVSEMFFSNRFTWAGESGIRLPAR